MNCVAFARKHFKEFIEKNNNQNHLEEIKKMMTLLAFSSIENSPYKEYKEDSLWLKIINMFISDCCCILSKYFLNILELPSESGFSLTILSGMLALPQILKAEKIKLNKNEILNSKELPYEIYLNKNLKFHSIFICPVTKEVSTIDNPPMLLNCGHVVSRHALEKMTKGSASAGNSSQIKCPTCPNTQASKDALELKIF